MRKFGIVFIVIVVLYSLIDFFFIDESRVIFKSFYIPNAAIVAADSNPDREWKYEKKDGSCVIVLRKEKTKSTVSDQPRWGKVVWIVVSGEPKIGVMQLDNSAIQVGFASYKQKKKWVLSSRPVSGELKIKEIKGGSFIAEYQISVSAESKVDLEDPNQIVKAIDWKGVATFKKAH